MATTVQSPAATLRAAWLAQAQANPWITFGLAATAAAVVTADVPSASARARGGSPAATAAAIVWVPTWMPRVEVTDGERRPEWR